VNPFNVLTFLGPPIEWALIHLSQWFSNFLPIRGSAFGFAVVVVTLVLRTALFPVFGWQVRTSRRIQAEQRLLAPQLNELRRKYRKEPQKLNEEMMKLYREHGISPFSNLSGCLPLLIQMPILYGLYRGITAATKAIHSGLGFLWIGNVSKSPAAVGILHEPTVLLLPLLAAAASFVQARMMMQPARPDMSEQELKMQSLSKNMLYIAPGMVLLFGIQLPQGLAIYWLTQSLVMVVQQWLVIGWGGLRVPPWFPGAGRVTALSYRTAAAAPGNPAAGGTSKGRAGAGTAPVTSGSRARPGIGDTRPAPPASRGGTGNGRAPRSVSSRAPGAGSRPRQGSMRRRGRGR
jgi:YidC/Oxa1 family membrane protein insertase